MTPLTCRRSLMFNAILLCSWVLGIGILSIAAPQISRQQVGTESETTEPKEPVQVSSRIMLTGGDTGILFVTASIEEGWFIHSITQETYIPTTISLHPQESFSTSNFKPERQPEIRLYDFTEVALEYHTEKVTWQAPIQFDAATDPADIVVRGKFKAAASTELTSVLIHAKLEARVEPTVPVLAPRT
ncbi:MAG: hypothetical protein CMJ46_07880 [Planctomyces sp.]|nr:hypothetical protein [Planctomyces sp.]